MTTRSKKYEMAERIVLTTANESIKGAEETTDPTQFWMDEHFRNSCRNFLNAFATEGIITEQERDELIGRIK